MAYVPRARYSVDAIFSVAALRAVRILSRVARIRHLCPLISLEDAVIGWTFSTGICRMFRRAMLPCCVSLLAQRDGRV